MIDLMIDIETLGNTPNAVCIQIAAVFFDRHTKELGAEFSIKIDPKSCEDSGFVVDESTLKWWATQDQEIFKDLTTGGVPAKDALESFLSFLRTNHPYTKDIIVWSHATFDFVIVQNYLKALTKGYLPYQGARDIRTLVDLAKLDLNSYDWSKKTHNALDDCKFQIDYCCDAINKLK